LCLAQINNCFAINKEICAAEGREALLQLVEEKGRNFDAVNVATCLNRSVGKWMVSVSLISTVGSRCT
jgi:hypothetical protein